MGIDSSIDDCEECLQHLDYGLLAFERHVMKAHNLPGKPLQPNSIPFCVITQFPDGPGLLRPVDISEIIRQLEELLPHHFKHRVILGLKLAVAIEKEKMNIKHNRDGRNNKEYKAFK